MKAVSRYLRDASFCPLSLMERIELKRLCAVARRLDTMQAIPATSSNFSLRSDRSSEPSTFLISRSGIHKRLLEPTHFIRTNLAGVPVHPLSPKPSDETLLHAVLYKHLPQVGSIVHCHARELEFMRAPEHRFEGHELLKALGKNTHEEPLDFPVFRNSQDMTALAEIVEKSLFEDAPARPVFGFMLERHGIYVVGKNVAQAEMRLEALLHLLATQT